MTTLEAGHRPDIHTNNEHTLAAAVELAATAIRHLSLQHREVPETGSEAILVAAIHGLLPDVHIEEVRRGIDINLGIERLLEHE
jgi:hypothetical protein